MIAPYLDASAVIYLIEGSATVRAQVAAHIAQAEKDPAGRLLASRLSRLECRVKPLRAADAAMLATYDAFFTRVRLNVLDVSAAVLDRATELRARHELGRTARMVVDSGSAIWWTADPQGDDPIASSCLIEAPSQPWDLRP